MIKERADVHRPENSENGVYDIILCIGICTNYKDIIIMYDVPLLLLLCD